MDWQMRPKTGIPVVTRGRIQHLLAGAIIALSFGGLFSLLGRPFLTGVKWGIPGVFLFAMAWEGLTPLIARKFAPKWEHPYGDFIDMVFYLVGCMIVVLVSGWIGHESGGPL